MEESLVFSLVSKASLENRFQIFEFIFEKLFLLLFQNSLKMALEKYFYQSLSLIKPGLTTCTLILNCSSSIFKFLLKKLRLIL